ncbi:MAG TPA: hypothetical protein PKY31_11960 [Spirochaetota bacterium]|nr:hypothetical protein [Spirochaetota bacterium]
MNRTAFFRDIVLHLAIRLGVIAGIAAACALYQYWVENFNPPYVEPGGYDDTFLGVAFIFLFACMVWIAWLVLETPRLRRAGRRVSVLVNIAVIVPVITAIVLLAATIIIM